MLVRTIVDIIGVLESGLHAQVAPEWPHYEGLSIDGERQQKKQPRCCQAPNDYLTTYGCDVNLLKVTQHKECRI